MVHEEDGSYVISTSDDLVGAVGDTPQEALHEFWVEVRARLEYLRSNEARLHGRLVKQLRAIERDFPWL